MGDGESQAYHCHLVEDTEVVPDQVDELALHQVGITVDTVLVEGHGVAVLEWGEGDGVVLHGVVDVGELDLPGDQVGGEKDKVGQEARRYSVLARQMGDGESQSDHCHLVEDTEVVPGQVDQLAQHHVGIAVGPVLVEGHGVAVLHWGEGDGELVLPGDQVGGGKDKVGIS
jgi:hypothetical protein